MIHKASAEDATDLAWFKSSYSSGNEGDSCVELALTSGTVHVRDSKNVAGPSLGLTAAAWADFVPYASES
ncbi:DUF397 domain-containing protein [Streptomyces sp. NPDC047028]|uniref:DUF397 domain-containing protein n=1 Tax=Streptomyces sp. NPDC047028 TaxID=3155793 RepID=UPI0033F7B433